MNIDTVNNFFSYLADCLLSSVKRIASAFYGPGPAAKAISESDLLKQRIKILADNQKELRSQLDGCHSTAVQKNLKQQRLDLLRAIKIAKEELKNLEHKQLISEATQVSQQCQPAVAKASRINRAVDKVNRMSSVVVSSTFSDPSTLAAPSSAAGQSGNFPGYLWYLAD